MKDVEEYSNNDLSTCLEQAEKIAMCVIDSTYHQTKDEDEVCYENIHKVKKATQVLELVKCLKTTTVTK